MFLAARPLWLDEALLAPNVLDPAHGLLDPLINLQTAPLGFLLPVRILGGLLGPGERALRLLPLLGSLGAVFLLRAGTRRLLGPSVATMTAAFAALSPLLVRYGDELKPYATDALGAALALWLGARWLADPSRRRGLALVVGGLVIVFCSIPGIFIVTGTALGVLAATDTPTHRRRALLVAAAVPVWTALFAALYFGLYRLKESLLVEDFRPFVGVGARAALAVRGVVGAALVGPDAEAVLPPGTVGALGVAVVAGLVLLLRRHPTRATLVIGPMIALLPAYLAGRWPLLPRLLVWWVPALAILASIAVVSAARWLGRWVRGPARRVVAAAIVSAALAPSAIQAWRTSSHPPVREDVPAAMAALREAIADSPRAAGAGGPVVYVAAHAIPACRFYAGGIPERWVCEIPGIRVLEGDYIPLPVTPAGTAAWAGREAARVEGGMGDEIWLLLAGGDDARGALLAAVTSGGHVVLAHRRFEGVDLVRIRRGLSAPPTRGSG